MANSKQQGKEKEITASITNVYLFVVEDVINNVRADFQSEGVDDNVLNELQALWELKMVQSGAIQQPSGPEAPASVPSKQVSQTPPTPIHDLNVAPLEGGDEYENSSSDFNFPQTPALTSTGEPVMYQYMPPGPSEPVYPVRDTGFQLDAKLGSGKPSPFMQPPAPWMNQKHRGVELNMNETYDVREDDGNGFTHLSNTTQNPAPVTKDFLTMSTGKRKYDEIQPSGLYLPQRDGAGDVKLSTSADEVNDNLDVEAFGDRTVSSVSFGGDKPQQWLHRRLVAMDADSVLERVVNARASSEVLSIAQMDGIDDNYDDDVAEEDYNEPGEDDPQAANDAAAKSATKADNSDSEGSEPPLNEDDDDEDDDDEDNAQGDEEPKTNHLVLAQFDKVTRSKNKWKCTLKDGIMHLNNRDILFVKATGEFEF